MATREQFKLSRFERQRRRFSEEFKRKKVREIEQSSTTVSQVSRQYEVTRTNVNRWIARYGQQYKKGERLIVESKSDTARILELQARIAELERLVGQKQIQLDFKDKMIELAEEAYSVDIKKKFESKPLSGSGSTGKG